MHGEAADGALVVVGPGRHVEFGAGRQVEGRLERRVLAEEDNLRPVAARPVGQRRRLRGDVVQPVGLVEQLAVQLAVVLVHLEQRPEGAVADLRRRRAEQLAQLDLAHALVEAGQGGQAVGPQPRLVAGHLGQFLDTRGTAEVGQRLGRAETHQGVAALKAGLQGGDAFLAQGLQAQGRGDRLGRVEQLARLALAIARVDLGRVLQRDQPGDTQVTALVEVVLPGHLDPDRLPAQGPGGGAPGLALAEAVADAIGHGTEDRQALAAVLPEGVVDALADGVGDARELLVVVEGQVVRPGNESARAAPDPADLLAGGVVALTEADQQRALGNGQAVALEPAVRPLGVGAEVLLGLEIVQAGLLQDAAAQAGRLAVGRQLDLHVEAVAQVGAGRDEGVDQHQGVVLGVEDFLDVLDAAFFQLVLQEGAILPGRGAAPGAVQAGDQADAADDGGGGVGHLGDVADGADLRLLLTARLVFLLQAGQGVEAAAAARPGQEAGRQARPDDGPGAEPMPR